MRRGGGGSGGNQGEEGAEVESNQWNQGRETMWFQGHMIQGRGGGGGAEGILQR